MNKEKLEKEAGKWLRKYLLCCNCEKKCNCIESNSYCEQQVIKAYVDSAEPREKHIEQLEKENAVLERRIERAKECMKKLLFIINSDPANYNCKGLIQDAEDFIYNRTCNIRKSGTHCITNEPCIMCDR